MSYSNNVKTELSKIPLGNREELKSEIVALLRVNGTLMIQGGHMRIQFSTENNPVARRIFLIIKALYNYDSKIAVIKGNQFRKKTVYKVLIDSDEVFEKLMEDGGYESTFLISLTGEIPRKLINTNRQIRAYIRGCFLGSGSISNPEKMYHLEIVFDEESEAVRIKELMDTVQLYGKITKRKEQYIFYYKDSEMISDLLSFMEAYQSVLKLEDIRAMKDLKNNINRVINCETANIDKTVAAAMKQKNAIEKIGIDNLPENLRTIAIARLKHPDASLKTLGELMKPEMSRSGVNYKLKKIEKIAEELTKKSN